MFFIKNQKFSHNFQEDAFSPCCPQQELVNLSVTPHHFFAVSRPCLYNGMPAHFADSPQMEAIYKMLSVTQPPPTPEVLAKLYRPASVVDKAHIHSRYAVTLFMLG